MSSLSDGVFDRAGHDTVPRSVFFLVLGAVLVFGFFAAGIAASYTAEWRPESEGQMWLYLGLGFLVPIAGIILSFWSTNPLFSFVGFNMVVIPLGAIFGPVLAMYMKEMPGVVTQAAFFTAGVTGVMTAAGIVFPGFFRSIGGALFIALLGLVGVGIAGFFIPELQGMTWIHYVAAGIFALYIGVDMRRAMDIPSTIDNAIDVAAALWLDIFNLFIRALAIFGQKR